ncbi:hypothetical protein [Rhodoferax saidenbachensis]|uniref:Pyridoxamine 5'-phosphate oxidase putative domain-containing protein n=1 Tax=Rhodoferax saidenbachensis TaxID=1484693 RepID=A0A1P8KEF2_9BURK|nr:hypothetical protein [Rhodoferax saidenbachensis]APW44345.1 hypothetical protein RS694_18675 [Rhodoferax saidenbachensis]
MSTPSILLPPELIALIAGGISTIVSSADAALRPSIMRAVGSTITPDGRTVTVYLARRQSRQLLQDLAATGRIAVVFSQPYSHRTLQLKADSVRTRPMEDADQATLAQYLQGMEQEVTRVGFNPSFTHAMLAYAQADVVSVSFEPTEAFDQTPGPRAGERLGAIPEADIP